MRPSTVRLEGLAAELGVGTRTSAAIVRAARELADHLDGWACQRCQSSGLVRSGELLTRDEAAGPVTTIPIRCLACGDRHRWEFLSSSAYFDDGVGAADEHREIVAVLDRAFPSWVPAAAARRGRLGPALDLTPSHQAGMLRAVARIAAALDELNEHADNATDELADIRTALDRLAPDERTPV